MTVGGCFAVMHGKVDFTPLGLHSGPGGKDRRGRAHRVIGHCRKDNRQVRLRASHHIKERHRQERKVIVDADLLRDEREFAFLVDHEPDRVAHGIDAHARILAHELEGEPVVILEELGVKLDFRRCVAPVGRAGERDRLLQMTVQIDVELRSLLQQRGRRHVVQIDLGIGHDLVTPHVELEMLLSAHAREPDRLPVRRSEHKTRERSGTRARLKRKLHRLVLGQNQLRVCRHTRAKHRRSDKERSEQTAELSSHSSKSIKKPSGRSLRRSGG